VVVTFLQPNRVKIITLTDFQGQDARSNLQNEYIFHRTVIEGRRILVPIKPRIEIMRTPPQLQLQPASVEPERTVLSDGSLQITYHNGTKKVISKNHGTVQITNPDGMSQIYSKLQIPFHDLPALPEDNPLNQWLHQESESLFITIERLLKSDQTAMDKYLTAYEGPGLSLYEKIHKRIQAIVVFTESQPE
jgi:hypothetical protein